MKSSNITFLLIITISLNLTTPSFSKSAKNTRIERSSAVVNQVLEKSSKKLFYDSKKMLEEKNYWDCSQNLILLLDAYPKYSEIDEVTYQLGECLYEMELLNGARTVYKYFASKYTKSPYIGYALSGLQRVSFDEQNFGKSLEIYKIIMKGDPSQEIIDYSSYYAGLALYQLGKFQETIYALSFIKDNSPYYDHSLYLKALSLLKLKKLKDAVQVFNDICKLPVYNQERINLINETHLTLGYLYYELGYYFHAQKQFNCISREYENYHNVLLSSGWTAVKLEQYKDAIIYLTEFITNYPETESTPEGLFLLGRCYLKLGLFDKALQSYEYLIDILPKTQLLADYNENINSYLETQLNEIENIKMSILVMESKFMNGISLDQKQELPLFIKEENNKLITQRSVLLTKIRKERQLLNKLSEKVKTLQNLSLINEQQKNWRGYAEYGKSRALFLVKRKQLQ
ncbi:tetratricopeptide repeat protein [candidate division KSB1 bacterium]|nr:tetratricopeptide repeat protein [candidate division KSB1 bacterium]